MALPARHVFPADHDGERCRHKFDKNEKEDSDSAAEIGCKDGIQGLKVVLSIQRRGSMSVIA